MQKVLLNVITNMLYFGYFNVLYYLSRMWPLTSYRHYLQVHGGSVKSMPVKFIEVNVQNLISTYVLIIFRQCFVVAKAKGSQGVF